MGVGLGTILAPKGAVLGIILLDPKNPEIFDRSTDCFEALVGKLEADAEDGVILY